MPIEKSSGAQQTPEECGAAASSYDALINKFRNAHPIFTPTGETGSFHRVVYLFPMYITPSGRKFYIDPNTGEYAKEYTGGEF